MFKLANLASAVAALFVVTAVGVSFAHAACETTGRVINSTSNGDVAMRMKQGESCDFVIMDRVRGFAAPNTEYQGVRIISRPRSGVAGVSGRAGFAYRPNPSFVGSDAFVVEVSMKTFTLGSAVTRVNVSVQVDP